MGRANKTKDYHNYVIKDGKFVGEFETMYKKCRDPWPEDIGDLERNPVSCYTISIIRKMGFKKLFTAGSGKGLHADWLRRNVRGLSVEGCEISRTAVKYSRVRYPSIKVHCFDIRFFEKYKYDFDVILFREILWYILPHWGNIIKALKRKYKGKYIILEISCYDRQKYGRGYFNSPEDIVKKFPFKIKEILRYHTSKLQREGIILIFGKII